MLETKGSKTLVSGSLWVFIGITSGYILEYANRIIIARSYGLSDYGVISLALTFSAICVSFSLLGFQIGAARYVAIYSGKEQKSEIRSVLIMGLKIIIPVSLSFSVFLMFKKGLIISQFFKRPSVSSAIIPFILLIPLGAIAEYFYSCLRGLKLAKHAVFSREVIRRAPTLVILSIIIIFNIKRLTFVSFAYMIGFAGYMLISGWWVKRNVSFVNKDYSNEFRIREFILFSFPLLFSLILRRVGGQMGNVFLGLFRDTKEVGLLSSALPFARIINLPLTVVLFMLLPVMSEYWHKREREELKATFKTVCNLLFCASSLIFLFFVLYSEPIIVKSFGEDFQPAHKALVILSIGCFFSTMCGPTGCVLLAAGESKKYFLGDLSSTIFALILYFLLIPRFGFLGAAYISMARMVLVNIIRLICVYRILRLHPFNRNILFALTLLILSVLLLKSFFWETPLGIQIVLTITVYFGVILMARVLRKESLILCYNLIKRKM